MKNTTLIDVFVVTNPENGWDCVCGVYTTYERILKDYEVGSIEDLTENGYILHHKLLEIETPLV